MKVQEKRNSYLLIVLAMLISSVSFGQCNKLKIVNDTLTTNIKFEILNLKFNINEKLLNFNSEHYKHKAFFCRLEDHLYVKTGKNIRFRLGNLDYVNILENK